MSEPQIGTGPAVSASDSPPAQRADSPRVRTSNWISLEIPEDWHWKESFTLLAPDGRANVIASTEPLEPEITLERYVQQQGDLLFAEFPEYHEFRLERVRVAGGVADSMLREFAWSPPDGERVRQLQVYAVRDGRGITATATTPETDWETHGEQLRASILSLLVRPR